MLNGPAVPDGAKNGDLGPSSPRYGVHIEIGVQAKRVVDVRGNHPGLALARPQGQRRGGVQAGLSVPVPRNSSMCSYGQIVRQALDAVAMNVETVLERGRAEGIKQGREIGYRQGDTAGYARAEALYRLDVRCADCGEDMAIPPKSKYADFATAALEARGLRHTRCAHYRP
jgi:hypothetical protein